MINYNDFISVVKRENNNKREFLLLNTMQAKHVPSKPSETLEMFYNLADIVKNGLHKYRDYIAVGFAETATAVGYTVGSHLKLSTMQTTRECVENVEYLFFSEEHSHATEQKIIKDDLDILLESDKTGILFIEDELTTGNTILNAVKIIRKTYPNHDIKFAVASIINCMSEEFMQKFKDNDINCFYCSKYNINDNVDLDYIRKIQSKPDNEIEDFQYYEGVKVDYFTNDFNMRRHMAYSDDKIPVERFLGYFEDRKHFFGEFKNKKILVLGTEEFMYIPLILGGYLETLGNDVYVQGTTRSPIVPSDEEGYCIKNRYKLHSMYDQDRVTYIYNMDYYDEVIVVSDAIIRHDNVGSKDIKDCLKSFGNTNISVIGWEKSREYKLC